MKLVKKKLGKQETKETLPRGPPRHVLKGHRDAVNSVRFHPVYDLICSASEDATLRIWDYEAGSFEHTLKGHTGAVRDCDFDPKGNIIASCSNDLTIKLWDCNSYSCIKTLYGHEHTVSSIKFLPSGDHLISSSRDKTIKVWETNTGYCIKTFEGHDKWIRRVAVNEDGSLVSSCSSDQTVRVWDFKTGKCLTVFREHTNVIECVVFAPSTANKILDDVMNDKKTMNNSSLDEKTLKEKEEKMKKPGLYVASGSRDKSIKIFESLTGRCVMTLPGHDNWVRSIAFHWSGKYLFSCSDDRSIRIWDLSEKRLLRTITDAHPHFIQCIDFNSRNPHLVSGGVDNVVHVWPCR